MSRLLSAAGLAAIWGEIAALARRARRRAILLAAAVLLWLLAFGFGLASLTIWLATEVGAIAAFGIAAAGFALVALVLQFIAVTAARRRPRSPLSALMGATPGAAEKDPPNGGALGAMAIVALAGYLIGRRLFRR